MPRPKTHAEPADALEAVLYKIIMVPISRKGQRTLRLTAEETQLLKAVVKKEWKAALAAAHTEDAHATT